MLFTIIGFTSCSHDDHHADEIAPSLELSKPTLDTKVKAGDILKVAAELSDNVELANYEVKISSGKLKSLKNIEQFSFDSNQDLDASGNKLPDIKGKKEYTLNFDISIPEKAILGDYTFLITCTDSEGNATTKKVYFKIVYS